MWLRYGVDTDNQLIEIEDVASGRTNLICPYCGKALIAKKGKIKEHHFAHAGETCNLVIKREPRDVPHLPLYDAFNIYLTGEELEQLKKLWQRHKAHNNGIDRLEVLPAFTRENLLETSPNVNAATERKAYQFTQLGQIPVGTLPLSVFNSVQEPLIEQKLAHLEATIFDNSGSVLPLEELRVRLADLRIYSAQMRKILEASLYYLKVQADGQVFHKIGITTRSIDSRLVEIYRDMRSHYEVVKIEVLGTWAHRANVERYFKYRYSEFNYPIGSLTEYFKFTNETQVVERDLHQMQAKVLSKVEQEVIGGKQDDFLSMVLADGQVSDRISANLHQNFLAKPSSQRIIAALHQGDRLRDAAASALVPVEVARKVLAVMQKQ
ncbi:GIY-YIG nuclease family protein [Synechocystis sp. PCC 7509]|uniref:GIY-YIG nuclease family protein n=1 Tax=Synechocystis sp. PCC 7509 TaxID=927677 RepID=UPI0002AC30D0|nr:GIY-YIG nuclease family protein [Synechocystis sp. PCC 7509]